MADAYEEQRRRQVEENERRIDELGLRRLAATGIPPKAKQLKRKGRVPRAAAAAASTATTLRRSGRVADLSEQPKYREPPRNLKRKTGVRPTAVERSYAIAKAKELEGQLGADYPTFVKTMTQHSATVFWLSLPLQFCKEHLPEHDEAFTLVDEEDHEFDVQYHRGPTAGRDYRMTWKWFAIDHKLDDGDCLVFQLIQTTKFKFKVYIIRASSYEVMMTIKTESC